MTGEQRGRQAPASYEIRVRGHLGKTMLRAFPTLHAETRDGDTLLYGAVADQAALHGALAQVEALGLELLEVRCESPGSVTSPRPGARDAEPS
jgi:epsilon-lactone hydrolase